MVDLTEFKGVLFDYISEKRSLQQALDMAAELLACPLHVTDASYKLICTSRLTNNPDPLWLELVTNGYFSEETVEKFHSIRLSTRLQKNPDPVYFEALGFPYLITPVVLEAGRVASLLALVADESDGQRLSAYLQVLAQFVRNGLLLEDIQLAHQSGRAEVFLRELLDGKTSKASAVAERGRYLGFLPGETYAILLVRADDSDHTPFPILYFKNMIPTCFPTAVGTLYHHNLVILLRFNQYRWYERLDFAELTGYLEKYPVHGCLSVPFSGLEQLAGRYRDTLRVLSVQGIYVQKKRILRCHELALHGLFDAVPDLNPASICHPAVLHLYKCDQENGTSYVDTLHFLLSCRKKQEAQRALFIHKNTLDYRIERMEQLIHIPWDDYDELFSMALSCRIVREFIRPGVSIGPALADADSHADAGKD